MDSNAAGRPPEGDGKQRLILQMSNLSRALGSGETGEGFQAVLDYVEAFLRVDAATLILKQPGNDGLTPVASSHLHSGRKSANSCPGEGLARAAMESAEMMAVSDLAAEPRDALGSLASRGFRSSLVSPILVGDHAAGALVALSQSRREFTVGDLEVLWELAKVVGEFLMSRGPGWTIKPNSLSADEDADGRLGDMRFFNRLSDALISASTLQDLLDQALKISVEGVDAQVGSLMLFDPRTRQLVVEAAVGLPGNLVKSMSRQMGEGIAGYVAQHQKTLLVNEPQGDLRFQTIHPRKEISSALCVPLRTSDRLVGVLNLARLAGREPFTNQDARLLETVANQLAIAAERMRLHQDLQKRTLQLTTLMEIGKTITGMLDLSVVTEQIAVQARNLVRAQGCFLYYYDQMNDRVRFAALSGYETSNADARRLASTIALEAVRRNKFTRCSEVPGEKVRRMRNSVGASGWCATPFRHRGHRVAVAVIIPRPDDELDSEAEDLLEQFGTLAGVSIQNARTYSRQRAIASAMQESMLTPTSVSVDGLDISHRLIPEHEVGGDYYDFFSLGDNRLGVVMADVSGSSVRAAAYTIVGKHALRAYARESMCPAETLRRLNRLLCEESETEIFISVFYGILDVEQRHLTYAMAGHEPPLLLRNGRKRCEMLRAEGMLLGIHGEAPYEPMECRFDPGDLLVLYTDGLTESPYHGRRYGLQRLKKAIKLHCELPANEIADLVVKERMRFSDNRMTDDMSLVVVRSAPG